MDLYGRLLGRVLLPAWEAGVRRRPTMDRLRALQETQWSSLEDLLAQQFTDLRGLLRHAIEHVPYYRTTLREAGVEPNEIRTERDLLKIPLLTREQAQASTLTRCSTVAPFVEIRKSTSGTLGLPVTFGYEDADTVLRASGLLENMVFAVLHRVGTVRCLFLRLTGVIAATGFVIPSTSGRAALMLPVFLALARAHR